MVDVVEGMTGYVHHEVMITITITKWPYQSEARAGRDPSATHPPSSKLRKARSNMHRRPPHRLVGQS